MAVNFTKNQDEITRAWRQVTDSKDAQYWALFGYEGNSNNIKLMNTGSKGLEELVQEFHCSLIQYAFCRVIEKDLGINKLILINWQGDSSPLQRKGLCASHVGDVANYFKGCSLTLTIRNDDEATKEYLMEQIVKSSSSSSRVCLSKPIIETTDIETEVGSTYKKTDIKSEISADRKSFWQRQEEEEKERIIEERKRAAERQAQFEKERKLREETEAKKLAETIKERDRIIEATRQADRRESTNSQPSSILSANTEQDNDDDRVGRRSEIIRLERNQETLSIISKGLIKNKRAIFEQASQQQQSQPQANSGLTRRTSGVIVSQRLNTFKSLDSAGDSNADVEKVTNGLAKQEISDTTKSVVPNAVKKEVENFKITPERQDLEPVSIAPEPTQITDARDVSLEDEEVHECTQKNISNPQENGNSNSVGDKTNGDSNDSSYSNNNDIPMKSSKQEMQSEADELTNGSAGIKARALYDYQAADSTEISFDPNDIIGFIEKVDPGWWQGSVITGPYKGQSGLFPSNYVQEL